MATDPISRGTTILREWILRLIARSGTDAEEQRRRQFHVLCMLIAIPITSIMSIIALVDGLFLSFAIDVMLLLVVVGSTLWLARLDDGRPIYRLNLLAVAGVFVALCALPEMRGNGFVWIFLYPPITFYALGPRDGLVFSGLLLSALAALFLLPLDIPHLAALGWSFKGRLLGAYLALTLFTWGYEAARTRLFAQILSDQERLQEEKAKVDRARAAAEAATQAKSLFLANVSHEIRTPIYGVTGVLDLLDEGLDAARRDHVAKAKRSVSLLLRVIDDVLDFSRIEAGRLDVDDVELDLIQTVQDVAELFRGRARADGLGFSVSVSDDVPRHLRSDPVRISQVLANLLSNALKFTRRGRVDVSVTLDGRDAADRAAVRFDVRDTGIGVPQSYRADIFEPFTQADASTTRRFGGTGLGLSIAAHLARKLGGEIGYESTVEAGSVFWFTIVAPVVAEPTHGAAPTLPRERPAPSAGERRVLLVEDNEVNRKVATAMLTKLGCQVSPATDGVEALALVAEHPFDLVLMDCQMPRLDGYETTARIKAATATRSLPVVALTAHATTGARQRCLAAGMDDYLVKPFTVVDLKQVLARWCADAAEPRATTP